MNRFSYPWEAKAAELAKVGNAFAPLSTEMVVIGVAVLNTETGEAALLESPDAPDGVLAADAWKDVSGDVGVTYAHAVENMVPSKGEEA